MRRAGWKPLCSMTLTITLNRSSAELLLAQHKPASSPQAGRHPLAAHLTVTDTVRAMSISSGWNPTPAVSADHASNTGIRAASNLCANVSNR